MDFLISNKKLAFSHRDKFLKIRTDKGCKSYLYESFNGVDILLIGDTLVKPSEHEMFFWDGHYSLNGIYRHSLEKDTYPGHAEIFNIIKDVYSATGCFMVSHIDVSSCKITMSSDVLNQYPIYYYTDGTEYCISNKPSFIYEHVGLLKKTARSSIENVIFGAPFNSTHIQGVKKLRLYEKIEISGSFFRIKTVNHAFKASSYDEAIHLASESINSHVQSIFQSLDDKDFVTDLTGGADSRAMLAFLLKEQPSSNIGIRCMGTYPNPDANVAAYIKDRFNLRSADFPIIGNSPEVILRNNAQLAGGGIQADLAVPAVKQSQIVHFNGFYGGIDGNVFDHYAHIIESGKKYSTDLHSRYIFERRYNSGIIDIVNCDYAESVVHDFKFYLDELVELGVSESTLSHEVYLRNRSANHYGMSQFLKNMSSIVPCPFANHLLVEARKYLPPTLSSKRKVMFDLIGINFNDLLWLPMANRKWDQDIISLDQYKSWENQSEINFSSENLTSFCGELFNKIPVQVNNDILPFFTVSKSDSQQTHLIHHYKINFYQSVAKFFISELDSNNNLWEYWDRDKIREICNKNPDRFRNDGLDVELLGIFNSSAIWLNNLEMTGQVE